MKDFFYKSKIRKWIFLRALPAVIFLALLFFLLRGPYLSNSIKRVLIPVLENATGERIITDHAVINLFPFYLQVKSVKVFDKEGNRLLWITKTRAYIDLFALLSREIRVRKLTLKEPNLTITKQELDRVIRNVKKYLFAGEGSQFRFSLKSIKLTDGDFILKDTDSIKNFSGSGLFVNMVLKDKTIARFSVKDGTLQLKDRPELSYRGDGRIKIGDDGKIEISELKLHSLNSILKVKGEVILSPEGRVSRGKLNGKAEIFVDTINKFFGLKKEKDGVLSFSGTVDLASKVGSKWPEISVDLDSKGWFYLETLMRHIKANANVKGKVSFDGAIRGAYPEVLGEGKARLENAVLGTLRLDDVVGEIGYKDRKFTLKNFIAHTFEGELRGDAFIVIPYGDYSVTANVSDIVSTKFFEFIKWNAPFPKGIIGGNFKLTKLHGQDMEVESLVDYLNTSWSDRGPLNRLERVRGNINYRSGIIGIENSIFSTASSKLYMDGRLNLKQRNLDFEIRLESIDASDLTSPSFMGLKAPVRFAGRAKGSFKDPKISGSLEMGPGSIMGILFANATADLTYRINSLSTHTLEIKQGKSTYNVSGSILFRKAKRLFSYDDPFYDAEIVINDGNAKSLISAFYKEPPLAGTVNGRVVFKGDANNFTGKGDLFIRDSVIYGQNFDEIAVKAVLSPEKIDFHSLVAYKNKTQINAEGTLSFDEKFNVSISSSKIKLSDIDALYDYPVDALFSLDLEGTGTLKKPHLKFSIGVIDSMIKGVQIGTGLISGVLDNRELLAKGSFLDGTITANGKATFSEQISWTADVDFKNGRYDFLLATLFKEMPRDISVSVEGTIRLKGLDKKISMQSRFSTVSFSLYGYNFRNSKDIMLDFADKKFTIKSLSLVGDEADLSVAGEMKIGENFNVKMKGSLNIAPLRAATDKIASLKGGGEFVVELTGPWEAPVILGEVNIKNATISIAGFPYKIGPVNGDIFLKKDRLTFESLRANFAGGTVEMSGIGYLKRLSLEKLFISSEMTGIKLRHIEGVRATLDGQLFYETSPEDSTLTGEINIKHAKYEKRVEWKSWLIGLKETKKGTIGRPTFLEKTALNIHITASDSISIDNNIARTLVEPDLTLVGTIGRYGLLGRIEADEGSIYFRGNEFEIIDGRVDFIEPNSITPVFSIRAKTFTNGYLIKLNLDGSIEKLALSLYSDPPLSEMDILTLLTSGQIDKEERGFESGIAAGEATAILTGGLQDVVEEGVKNIIGFERFEIYPQTTATGAVSPKITVGKRMLNDKLSVIYSTSIGTTDENIVRLKYTLGKNISIVGSRDEIGSTGVDVKYRFEFK